MTRILLSELPPSTNALHRAVAGRVIKSKKYRAWQTAAGKEIMAQRPAKHKGPVTVGIMLADPERRSDIDNKAKALLDLLQEMQIIENDDSRILRRLNMEWVSPSDMPGGKCLITVWGME